MAAAKVEEQLAGYGERVGAYLSGLAGQAVEGAKEKLLHAIRGTGSHAVALVMWPSDAVAGTKVFCGEEWAKGEVEQGLRQAEMLQATLERECLDMYWRFGSLSGDRCLTQGSACIKKSCRLISSTCDHHRSVHSA